MFNNTYTVTSSVSQILKRKLC